VATIAARFPPTAVVICETRVQGKGAAESIVSALAALAAHPDVDVVVLSRGGGSFEDLLPFSDEAGRASSRGLAGTDRVGRRPRAGHPRCATWPRTPGRRPQTAAAALVVPSADELEAALRATRRRLGAGVRAQLDRSRGRVERQGERLRSAPPLLLERRPLALDHAGARLQALSPLATLARGYAIVRSDGEALRDAASVRPATPSSSARLGVARSARRQGTPVSDDRSFEELQRELEEIVARLERGDVPVDEAIALFRRGEEVYKACVERLQSAELRIEELAPPEAST
jgi:exodeoxyribonuclease VII large subunit